MKTYEVCITEFLETVIEVSAQSRQDALRKVEEMYRNEEIILTSDDYITTDIKVVSLDD